MKLAIPYEEGQIFQHFGKTPAFKIYDIANGQVGGSMVFPTGGQGHGALASLLRALGIGAVVCGGIGSGAIDALSQLNTSPSPASPAPPTKPPRTLPRASWWLTPTLSATTTTAATPAATTAKDTAAAEAATEARPSSSRPACQGKPGVFLRFYPLSISAKNPAKYQRIFSEKITENGCNLQEVLL